MSEEFSAEYSERLLTDFVFFVEELWKGLLRSVLGSPGELTIHHRPLAFGEAAEGFTEAFVSADDRIHRCLTTTAGRRTSLTRW